MPLIDYLCDKCNKTTEIIAKFPIPTEVLCELDDCGGTALKQLSSHSSYKINGNNSASVTPKRFRGET